MTSKTTLKRSSRISPIILLWSLAAATVFLFLRCFLLPGIPFASFGDQNLFFARAVHLLDGYTLYRDVFELVPPGTDLMYAAALRLFGLRSWIPAGFTVATGVLLFGAITMISRRMIAGLAALLPGALFLLLVFDSATDMTHHWYSTLAALGALWVMMEGQGARQLLAAGALCGLATMFTQTQGAMVSAAIAMVIFCESESTVRVRRLALFLAPLAAVVVGMLGYCCWKAGVGTVGFDLLEFPRRYLSSGEVNSPKAYLRQFPRVHSLGDGVRALPFVFVYALVPYVYIAGFLKLRHEDDGVSREQRRDAILLLAIGVALFLAVASAPRFFRLCTVAAPAVVTLVWLLEGGSKGRRAVRGALFTAMAAMAVLLVARRQMAWHGVLDLPTGRTAFSDQGEFREFAWLAQRTRRSDPFFDKSVVSFYLALDTPPVAELINEEEFSRPEQVTAIVEWMEKKKEQYVVIFPDLPKDPGSHSNAGPFHEYVRLNYRLREEFPMGKGNWREQIWERISSK